MKARERVQQTLNHQEPKKLAVDFGATLTTGITAPLVFKLRKAFGLKEKPIRIIDIFQMLGEIDEELCEKLDVDCAQILGRNSAFGFRNENWKEWTMFDGTPVLVPEKFNTRVEPCGGIFQYPEGDTNCAPSGYMPKDGYYFDPIVRQNHFDEDNPSLDDNLEEFVRISDEELEYISRETSRLYKNTDLSIVGMLGGTGLGDIARVPAVFMKDPKGIRSFEDWYISLATRQDFLKELYDRQTDIALENIKLYDQAVGNMIDTIFLCGTDLGTQSGQFCSAEAHNDVYVPYYKKMTNWIRDNTNWKIFKHSCGSIMPLIDGYIEAGFDIINPVQITAANMEPQTLKDRFGSKITFWGGGVNTQNTLAFGTPEEVYNDTCKNINIFRKDGGFVFNTIHNVQANVPVKNFLAMMDAVKDNREAS